MARIPSRDARVPAPPLTAPLTDALGQLAFAALKMQYPPQIDRALALVRAGRPREAAQYLRGLAEDGDGPANYQWAEWHRDAEGPVTGTLSGPRATIRYRDRNGFRVEQHLALQSDGRTILNELSVRRFGVRLARLDETIRKSD